MVGVRFSHPLLRMKLLHRLCGSFFHDIGKYELSYIIKKCAEAHLAARATVLF